MRFKSKWNAWPVDWSKNTRYCCFKAIQTKVWRHVRVRFDGRSTKREQKRAREEEERKRAKKAKQNNKRLRIDSREKTTPQRLSGLMLPNKSRKLCLHWPMTVGAVVGVCVYARDYACTALAQPEIPDRAHKMKTLFRWNGVCVWEKSHNELALYLYNFFVIMLYFGKSINTHNTNSFTFWFRLDVRSRSRSPILW